MKLGAPFVSIKTRAALPDRWDALALLLVLGLLIFLAEASSGALQPLSTVKSAPISLDPGHLPLYAARTTLRMFPALALSLALFSFVVLAVAGRPDMGHLVSDLAPLPSDAPHDYFALVVAIVGASIMPWMLFYQQSASVDKDLSRADLHGARIETLVGAFASQALMAAVVIAAAAAMQSAPAFAARAANLADLPEGMARLADGGAGWLIAIGLVGSGLLALIVVSLSAAWGIGELMGWPHSLDLKPTEARKFYAVYFAEVLPAAAVALLSADLVRLCVGAMVFNVIVLALPLAFLVRLTSDRVLLGDLANSRRHTPALQSQCVSAGLPQATGLIHCRRHEQVRSRTQEC